MRSATERFWSWVNKTDGCWEWQGCPNSAMGYGVFQASGKRTLAHRFAYAEANGEIPEGLCVLHKCDNPKCVRPDHLWLGTAKDNSLDKVRKGRCGKIRGNPATPKTSIDFANAPAISSFCQLVNTEPALSAVQVAKKLGVSSQRVYQIAKEAGFKRLWSVNGDVI